MTIPRYQHHKPRPVGQPQALSVRHEQAQHRAEQAPAVAEFPEPHRPPADRTPDHHDWQRRETYAVRERAANVLAAVGPAALEFIAEFRARHWARLAASKDDPVDSDWATAHAAEWQRIAASVSKLLAWEHDE